MTFAAQLKQWSKLRWAIYSLSALYAGFFIYLLIARPGTPQFYHAFQNVYQMLPPIFSGVCGLVLAFKGKHATKSLKAGWFFIAMGCLSFAMGQGLWFYYESIRGIEVPSPGICDVGYVGSYPCLLLGMVLLFNNSQVVGRARLLLDSAIAASSLGMLSWYFIIGKLWAKTDVSMLGKIISVAYPLGDFAVIFMAIVMFNSLTRDRAGRRSMALLGVGMVLITFADTVYLLYSLKDAYETGNWNDWGWSFGWLLMGFACLNRLWNAASKDQSDSIIKTNRAKPWVVTVRAFGPYVGLIVALGITFGYDYFTDGHITLSEHTEAIVLGALIVIRQVFMLMENVGLNRRIGAINDDLERRVDERTRQLTCLQDLTRAVNTTLDVDLVLSEGAKHSAGLMNADAAAIWLPKTAGDRRSGLQLRHNFGFDEKTDFLENLSSKIHFAGEAPVAITEVMEDGRQAHCLITRLNWQSEQVGALVIVRWETAFESVDHDLIGSVGVELGSALHNAIEHAIAVEAADHDPVTGLYNHRAFHQRFQSTLAKATTNGTKVSLIMLDLNNFKLFNDTYGHMAGDQVLKTVAKTMSDSCPRGTLTGRYGGDEFIIALTDTDGDAAEQVANHLTERLAKLGFTRTGDERKIPITLSAGIATFPTDANSRHDLLALADQNLYSAKASEAPVVRISATQRENRALRAEGSFEVLDALVTAVDNKDRYTRKHSEDVTEYALWMAEELGLSQETMRIIRIAGLLHDVGKIGVPSEVLRKPGRLTPEEYEIIKRHPRLGEFIVSAIPGMDPIVDGVRSHHERWDGQGYPDQLAGEQIPFLGRLLAVADAFSAMTTDRPYRKGMDWDVALEQIEVNKGSQFDPSLADVFLRAVAKRREIAQVDAVVDAA